MIYDVIDLIHVMSDSCRNLFFSKLDFNVLILSVTVMSSACSEVCIESAFLHILEPHEIFLSIPIEQKQNFLFEFVQISRDVFILNFI